MDWLFLLIPILPIVKPGGLVCSAGNTAYPPGARCSEEYAGYVSDSRKHRTLLDIIDKGSHQSSKSMLRGSEVHPDVYPVSNCWWRVFNVNTPR